jgi:hypothetical protein
MGILLVILFIICFCYFYIKKKIEAEMKPRKDFDAIVTTETATVETQPDAEQPRKSVMVKPPKAIVADEEEAKG